MTTEPVAPETRHAWHIVLNAGQEARRRGDRRIGTEHLLLALLEDPVIAGILGVDIARARHTLASLDREALDALGVGPLIDAPPLAMRAVPRTPRLRDVAHRDRLHLTPAAKKLLEEAARHNRRRLQVTGRQVLTSMLALPPQDPAMVLLRALGVNPLEVALP